MFRSGFLNARLMIYGKSLTTETASRRSEREPAVSSGDKSNVTGSWLPSLTFSVRCKDDRYHEPNTKNHEIARLRGCARRVATHRLRPSRGEGKAGLALRVSWTPSHAFYDV